MKIFIDLDDTLCDWTKGVKDLGPAPAEGLLPDATDVQKQVMYDAIEAAGADWWANLVWLPDGKETWKIFESYGPVLLSSPGKFRYAPEGKKTWVLNNIPGVSLFLSDSKSDYVDPYETCILVDDNPNNIEAWDKSGGRGILHKSASETEKKFLEILLHSPSAPL